VFLGVIIIIAGTNTPSKNTTGLRVNRTRPCLTPPRASSTQPTSEERTTHDSVLSAQQSCALTHARATPGFRRGRAPSGPHGTRRRSIPHTTLRYPRSSLSPLSLWLAASAPAPPSLLSTSCLSPLLTSPPRPQLPEPPPPAKRGEESKAWGRVRAAVQQKPRRPPTATISTSCRLSRYGEGGQLRNTTSRPHQSHRVPGLC